MARQVVIVQIQGADRNESSRLLYFPECMSSAHSAGKTAVARTGGDMSGLKKTTEVDEIRVGKTSYFPSILPVSSYDEHVGDVTIEWMDIEARIDSVMAKLNNEKKIKQCSQGLNVNHGDDWGTIFWDANAGGSWDERIQTARQWQETAINLTGGIPLLIGGDAVHGFCFKGNGTILPHNLGLGCSGDPRVVEIAERVCAIECAALGLNWTFAPCMDIVRNERHGRTYEGFDEGPEGSAVYARAAVRGIQGTDLSHPYTIAATAKHFAGAGGTVDGIHKGNAATGTYEQLAHIHLPPFRAACEEGVASVMAAFNAWLGTQMHCQRALLTDTLKNGWKWGGFVVGDWNSAYSCGLINSYNAGVDNPMLPDNVWDMINTVLPAVGSSVPQGRLDDATRRILRVKFQLGLFDGPWLHSQLRETLLSQPHRDVARMCVRKSLVCLKNSNNALPIDKGAKVFLTGRHGNNMQFQCGGWTLGVPTGASENVPQGTRVRGAFEAVVGSQNVIYASEGGTVPSDADVIVVCIGEIAYFEDGGDSPDLTFNDRKHLFGYETGLIDNAVSQANGRPVIVLFFSGRPRIITGQIDRVDAWVNCWLPGTEGAGITDVLFGDYDFTGKLTHTWPRDMSQIPINHGDMGDWSGSGGEPLFEYGYGLNLAGERIR
jgi:beta-glucosidase